MTRLPLLSLVLFFFLISTSRAQQVEGNKSKMKKDMAYEMKHKSQPWFDQMKPGANYFDVKKNFDKYFGNHRWEKSKPRSLGMEWLKSAVFYLNADGVVQEDPSPRQYSNGLTSPNQIETATTTQVGTWSILGPVNSAHTGYSGKGNHGGYVSFARMDPTNTQKMFVGFITGGLWMTVDQGNIWTLVDGGYVDAQYIDLDVCIDHPQTVYALTTNQLLKSTDGGLNWESTSLVKDTYPGQAHDMAVSTSDPDVVVVRWGNEILRTTDGGASWTAVVTGLPAYKQWYGASNQSEMVDWSTSNNQVVYFLSTSNNNAVHLYRSADAGASFTKVHTITLAPNAVGQVVGWAKLLLPTNNTQSLYVAIGTGDNAYGQKAVQLYKLNATTGEEEAKKVNMISGTNPDMLHHGDLMMDRHNENKIVFGTYGQNYIHISTNQGASFTASTDRMHSDIRAVDMIDGKVLVGNDGEAVLSHDGGDTFTTITNSIGNHELWGFGSAFKSDLVASGNNHGPVMIKEAKDQYQWYNGTGADQGNTDVNPLDDRYIYSQGYSNYRYFRTGVHQLVNEPNFLDLGGIYSYFNSIEFHPNYYYTIITHHAGQYPTDNPNLNTWKKSLIKTEDNGNSLSIVKTFSDQVFREKICMTAPDHMYVVVGLTNNKLWYTSDGGTTWQDVTPSSLESNGQRNISDVAVSDVNPHEVWITYSGVQSACKVLKSTDAGSSWTNLTQPVLTDYPNTKIIFQRGTQGGVYVGNKSGIYYRNNDMANWEKLGNGLPAMDVRFMFINYNLGKLRIGGSRGAWEHELYEVAPPKAQVSASTARVICPLVETVQFKDYSTVRNASATWEWSFPGGQPSSSTEENPVVSYKDAEPGVYDVTLKVTDAHGTDTQTIKGMIQVLNQCGTNKPDTIPGKSAYLSGQKNRDYIAVEDLEMNKSSFTFSCWIKPKGTQTDYSSIFMSQETGAFGLNFLPGSNELGYHPVWWWSSGLFVLADTWSHVALVSNGSSVTIYLNGKASTNNQAAPFEVFSKLFIGNYGLGRFDRFVDAEIDEVAIWDRPLSADEIRKWRHLTKSKANDPITEGLIAYYQFNEESGAISLNKSGEGYARYSGAGYEHKVSTAPVFGGISEKKSIKTGGVYDFTAPGLKLTFPSGTVPNGDVWVSKAAQNPDQLPGDEGGFESYWIVNNYGTNETFDPLTTMEFYQNNAFEHHSGDFGLYHRTDNAAGATWGQPVDGSDARSGSGNQTRVTFSSDLQVQKGGQFVLMPYTAPVLSVDSGKPDKTPGLYPVPLQDRASFVCDVPQEWHSAALMIFDMQGKRRVLSTLKEGKNQMMLNLPSGSYIVNIAKGNRIHSSKLVIE